MSSECGFTEDRKNFLQGFAMGSDVARTVRGLPILSGSALPSAAGAPFRSGAGGLTAGPRPAAPEQIHAEAQDRVLATGQALSKEEKIKREKDGLAMWGEIRDNARQGIFPRDGSVFLYKYSGLYVAPAQDSFLCRLGSPAECSRRGSSAAWPTSPGVTAAGYVDVTTRANLQIREIGARSATEVLTGLTDLGIINRGAGADNIRNITAARPAASPPRS